MHTYLIPPVDSYEGLIPAWDWLAEEDEWFPREERLPLIVKALEVASQHPSFDWDFGNWNGRGIWLGFLPGDVRTEPYALIKLENNGNTFVVSPHPLPHLEALAL